MDRARQLDTAPRPARGPDRTAPQTARAIWSCRRRSDVRKRKMGGWAVARFLIAVGVSGLWGAVSFLGGRFAVVAILTGPSISSSYPPFANVNLWASVLGAGISPVCVYGRGVPFCRDRRGYVRYGGAFGPLRSRARDPPTDDRAVVGRAPPTAPPTPDGAFVGPPWGRGSLPGSGGRPTASVPLPTVAPSISLLRPLVSLRGAGRPSPPRMWARRTDGQRGGPVDGVNGVGGAVAAGLSLWFVSAHTVVATAYRYPVVALAGLVGVPSSAWSRIGWWSATPTPRGRTAPHVELTAADGVVGADRAVSCRMVGSPRMVTTFPKAFDGRFGVGRREA